MRARILVVMVAGGVTVHGKENLFIFRKAPSGVGSLAKAKLIQSWLVVVPIAGAITAVTTILSQQTTFLSLLTNTGLMMLIVAANVVFALGLFLLNPPFSEKSVKMWLNVMTVMFVSIGLFAVSVLALTTGGMSLNTSAGMLNIQLLQIVLSWLVGIVFLYFGKMRLGRIE